MIKEVLSGLNAVGEFTPAEFDNFFRLYDDNGDNKITRVELKDFVVKFLSNALPKEAGHTIDSQLDYLFTKYDKDHNGTLSKDETRTMITDILTALGGTGHFTSKQFDKFFATYDDNGDNKITRTELKDFVEKLMSGVLPPDEPTPIPSARKEEEPEVPAQAEPEEEVKQEEDVRIDPPTIDDILDQIFAQYDKDNSNDLSKAETKVFIADLVAKLGIAAVYSNKQFEAFFKEYDDNGDNKISRAELKNFVIKL